jgi:hypothetical protein
MSLDDFLEVDNARQQGLMIVDFSQIVISTIQATFRPTDTLSTDLIRHVVLNTIRSNVLKNKREYPHIVLATDKGPYWRKKLAPYYKGHRKDQRDASDFDFKAIFEAMNIIREELIQWFPFRTMQIEGVEADDIAGVLVKRLGHLYHRILLISSDGDWAQLQTNRNIKQFSPMQKKWVLPSNGSPRLHLMEKVIKGDPKDCISNIKSVSDHLLSMKGTRQKSIFQKELDIWLHEPVENWAPDQFTKDRYYENLKLLDLTLIPEDIGDKIIAEFNKPVATGVGIFNYLVKHRMKELLGKVDEFL